MKVGYADETYAIARRARAAQVVSTNQNYNQLPAVALLRIVFGRGVLKIPG